MKNTKIFNSISIKLGILFSSVFLILLLILGSTLYGVFTNLFVDFVTNDLVIRSSNHAKALDSDYSEKMFDHVLSMEKGGSSIAVITDKNQQILGSSSSVNKEMKKYLLKGNKTINHDWKNGKYLVAVNPINPEKGYIYMFYPTDLLKETVQILKMLILITSVGTILLGFGLIGVLSRRITKPLLTMKDATNKIAQGKYKQTIPAKGNDEIVQLSNAIQRLGEQLQFYEDNRNEFLSAVSHELRTPLTYIKGYSDVLEKGMVKNHEEQLEYLTIINKESKRVAHLVDDLFEMSKLQIGKFQLNKEPADIHVVIEKVSSALQPAAERKGIKLKLHYLDQNGIISIDMKRMEQVFYNLIENAIKYTEIGEVKIESFIQNDEAVIKIMDSGIGIPQKEIPMIWDRFYRVDKSRTRKTGGTGLGLYIAKQIIESHNGEITVNSTENEGSTF
ncbi:MAG TPA: HAMP domain-containing sensor histidine kinase, partial [Bacillales bacterium]|nr:HAMP domain-containing sensor histidine kinase [Bacillales bacterium]